MASVVKNNSLLFDDSIWPRAMGHYRRYSLILEVGANDLNSTEPGVVRVIQKVLLLIIKQL